MRRCLIATALVLFGIIPTALAETPDAVGTWAVTGTVAGGEAYSGTLVIERGDRGALQARWALTEADGDPVERAGAAASVAAGVVRVGLPADGGFVQSLQGSAAGDSVQVVYDLARRTGEVRRKGQVLATETIAPRTRLVIVHTNDSHGQLTAFTEPGSGRRVGGFAARATLVARIRAEAARMNASVLVLDAGDVNTGPPESNLLDAEPDIEAMIAIGYDAMAIGNHEFDKGQAVLLAQRERASVRFPFLSANVLYEETGETMFQPTVVLKRGELRIGIVGLTTESAAYLTLPENRAGLRFAPALEAAAHHVPALRAEGADLVIALTHLGYYGGGDYAGAGSTPGEISLARTVSGIDVIVGGHSHTPVLGFTEGSGTIIVQAHDRGRVVGRLDLLLDEAGEVAAFEHALIPAVVEDPAGLETVVAEDPEIVQLLAPYLAQVNGKLDEVLGETPVLLDGERPHIRGGDTNLGFLVTDAYRAIANTDVAFAAGGGIRASIGAGPITYREVLTVLPFGNRLMRGELTGEQILEVAAIAAARVAPAGGWLQVSGLTWTFEAGEVLVVKIAGKPLDPDATYTVVVDRFLAEGGESYTPFLELGRREELKVVDAEALVAYLAAHGVPDYTDEDRVTVLSLVRQLVRTPVPTGVGPSH